MSDIYKQPTITDKPFKNNIDNLSYGSRQRIANGIYRPVTILDQPFPEKTIANEVVGGSINTTTSPIQVYKPTNFNQEITITGEGSWPTLDPSISAYYNQALTSNKIYMGSGLVGGNQRIGQSWKYSLTRKVVSIVAFLGKYFTDDPTQIIRMQIWNDNNGVPGTVLYTSDDLTYKTVAGLPLWESAFPSPPVYYAQISFYFLESLYLYANTQYYFILDLIPNSTATSGSTIYVNFRGSALSTGHLMVQDWNDTWLSTYLTKSMNFILYTIG